MPRECSLEEMKATAIKMSSYYRQGFGTHVSGILNKMERYAVEGDEALLKKAREYYNEIWEFYRSIPFEALQHEEDFYPLFIVRGLLPELKKKMELLSEGKGDALDDLFRCCKTIVNAGAVYYENLIELLDKIRSNPGSGDFRVEVNYLCRK
jgi:hypothetical protein